MIIDGKQKKSMKAIELCITSLGWIYITGFFIQLAFSLFLWILNITHIINELFVFRSLANTAKIILITVIAAFFSFGAMYLWRGYNGRKFGKLKRRSFPEGTDAGAISEYFKMTTEEVVELQGKKVIELEKTII